MAELSFLLPQLLLIYFFSKLSGFRHFYYHVQENTFKLLTHRENRFEQFFSHLISFINLAATPVYIWQRLRIEYRNEENYSIQPGVSRPPNFHRAITDSVYAVAYCLNCIVFRLNQQQFVLLGNELLVIHRALQKQNTELRASNVLLLLSYCLPIILFFTVIFNMMHYCISVRVCSGNESVLGVSKVSGELEISADGKLLMLGAFIGWNNLFYELHLQLLFMFYVLLSSYCRRLSDLLVKPSNKSVKRLEKLMKTLSLLQMVQQRASRYFRFYLLLRVLELLHVAYCVLNVFTYDDGMLNTLLEDLEMDKKMSHASVVSKNAFNQINRFVIQTIVLLLELHALSVCNRAYKNILDVITFPMDTHANGTALNSDQIYELETMPDTIIVCNDIEPHINLFELMLDNEEKLIRLSLDNTLGLHIANFNVPLKLLKRSVNQICCRTFVAICFYISQNVMLEKFEQKYK